MPAFPAAIQAEDLGVRRVGLLDLLAAEFLGARAPAGD